MKGTNLALSVTTITSDVVESYIDLQNAYQKLFVEIESLKVGNELLKVIAGE